MNYLRGIFKNLFRPKNTHLTTLSYLDQAFPGVFIDLGGSMTELVYQAREKNINHNTINSLLGLYNS